MFPSLAARETFVADAILLPGRKEMLLNQVKNIIASRTQGITESKKRMTLDVTTELFEWAIFTF